jgi:hypothetical protein
MTMTDIEQRIIDEAYRLYWVHGKNWRTVAFALIEKRHKDAIALHSALEHFGLAIVKKDAVNG